MAMHPESRVFALGHTGVWALLGFLGLYLLGVTCLKTPERFILGGDEGFELVKAMLVNDGARLYTDIWSDQPPLFTHILAAAQRFYEDNLWGPRIVAACFGALLAWAVWGMARQASGRIAGCCALLLLIAVPSLLLLSFSAMQEVPFLALSMSSGLLLREWLRTGACGYGVASALAFSAAVGIKLLAALVVPAIVLEALAGYSAARLPMLVRLRLLCSWGLISLLGCLLVIYGPGSPPASILVGAHAKVLPETIATHGDPSDFRFPFKILRSHEELLLGLAVFGVAIALDRGLLRRHLFPSVFLVTALFVHILHKPTWTFYYLHVAVPGVVLAACGLAECIQRSLSRTHRRQRAVGAFVSVFGLGLLVALLVTPAIERALAQILSIQRGRYARDVQILSTIARWSQAGEKMFAADVMFCVHADRPPPPGLAVLSRKRFWSGQITCSGIEEVLRIERPKVIVLEKTSILEEVIGEAVRADYCIAFDDERYIVAILKKVVLDGDVHESR